ncbi:MAG: helix-turn-helix transcriptional regulator [Planctomycetota bacterium]|jgi:proteasome accessory factor C
MALPLAKLRLYLSLIPLLRARPGITFKEIGDHLGISAQAAQKEIPEALMLCGVPPYMPHDYIACYTEGDRITVRFAEHFKRPAKLTRTEAAALLLALRALPPARGAPLAPAVAGLLKKLERALGDPEMKRLARRIGGKRRASQAVGQRISMLQRAVDEEREVEIVYYTQRRRSISTRTVRPYAIVEHLGNFYLVGRDSIRARELSFRVDRIRDVALTGQTFEKPRSFNAQRYRRPDFYRPGQKDAVIKVRFGEPVARYVREMSPPAEITEKPKGAIERALRSDSLRWVVDWSLLHGDEAEIVGPKEARAEAKRVTDEWLAFYKKHTK